MRNYSKIEVIIFDMDGVLIEAKEWHYDSLNKALKLFGFHISRHEHLTSYDGLPTKKKLEMLTLDSGLPKELHAFINEMKQIYTMEIIHTLCRPRFVHEYALSQLKNAGYRMAVASNSIRPTIDVMMDKARLRHYLEATFSAEDVIKGKPHPEIYCKAISHFGVRPDQCFVVEDNENGIKAAYASGAHVLVVRDVAETNFDNIMMRINEINTTLKQVA
jgi:beta-phosphoglucomutase